MSKTRALIAVTAATLLLMPAFFSNAWAGECVNDATRLGIYLPNLRGDKAISISATTVIHLRLLQELRRSTPDNVLQFGCAKIGWGASEPQDEHIDGSKIRDMAPNYASLVISGRIEKVVNGGVVSIILTRVKNHDLRILHPEVWNINFNNTIVSLDLVKTSYAFKPIIIPADVISKYSSKSYLRICAEKNEKCQGGKIGEADISAAINEGNYTYVKVSDGRKGWMLMPQWDSKNDVLPFISGLIYLMRGDFLKAAPSMERIAGSENEAAVRINALSIRAAILEREGQPGLDLVNQAIDLNPFAKLPIQVGVMSLLEEANRASGDDRRALIRRAKAMLSARDKLFDPKDNWFLAAKSATEIP